MAHQRCYFGREWALNLELLEPLAEAIVSNWDCAKFDESMVVGTTLFGEQINMFKY